MGKQRRVSASYDDEFDNLVARLRDNKDFANKFIEKHSTKTEDHFVQENFSNSKNNDYLDGNEDPHNFRGGLDLNSEDPFNDVRADRQSALDHLGIGAIRTVAKAATEVAKLPGVIGGIAISPFAAENEGFETAFNNQWIKFFDGLNEDVKEALPVYVKESVKNGDFFEKIGSSATWATEGADGAGYMLGALAPGGLFKYFGGAAKIFGTSAKAAKLGTFGKSMEAGRKVLKAAGITTKNIDQYMIPAFNTIAEAGAESKGVWDGMESRKGEAITNFKMTDPEAVNLNNAVKNGLINEDEYNSQMQELMDNKFEPLFKEQKALAAQNSFFKNTVVLAGPNYIQAKLLFGKTPSKVLLDKIGGLGEKSIKNTVKQGAKNFVKGFASEGAEEVGQSAVEHRNIEEGLKFKLGDSRMDDYNPLTFGDDFIKTLGTTDGQMAGFLGGIMGAPMSAYGGYKQDVRDRVTIERLREKINGASTAYADIKNTNIYEQEEYTNPETGEVGFRDKEVDGKKVFIPENVAKVKTALDLIEKDSNEYDNAVEDGDVEKIEQFRNRGEFNVIANFIGEDEVTLDALHEHLKVAFPTENSKDISDEQVKINKTNLERIDKIMSKAKHLQKDFVSFKDMSASILRINHPDITKDSTKEEKESAKEHLEDFLNRVGNTFLSERAEEYEAKQTLNKLEQQRLELENNSTVIEIDNPNYIEGVSSEFDKKTKTRSNNPRLELVNSLIDKVKEQLKGYEENTNSNTWNNELLNKQFAEEVELRKQIKEDNSPEQVAKNDAVITAVKSSTTEDEVTDIEKNAPKDVIKNPVIKAQINNKKAEIIQAEKVANETQIAEATQEDNDFNDTTGYSDLSGTEGSPVTDDLIPEEAENNTAQELKNIDNEEVLTGKGAQVISTDMKTGELFSFVSKDYLNYERNPINKAGKEVGFEINTNPGPNDNLKKALEMLEDKDFSNPAFLISYLPINVVFEKNAEDSKKDIKAPMETRRATGKLDSKKDKDGKDQFYINPATETLRSQIINHLVNGGSINDIKTTIQDQYKGLLKVDDNRFANNNILELDGVKDLKYVRDNLYVVDSFGNLMNIQSGKTKTFINSKLKPNAKGEIYLMIPQANGSEFPLKLNIKKINDEEANLLYYIYKEIITNDGALNTTVSQVNNELEGLIKSTFKAELKIIGGIEDDIKLQDIVDLLIYQSDNVKSQMHLAKDKNGQNVLMYSNGSESKMSTKETIEEDQEAITTYLVNSKRHQIKINPKFATDNTKTNLKSNSADYLKYLIDNNILSTNAVVNEPTFQGYTNIYLNTGVTVNNQPKTTQKVTEVSPEIADVEKRRQAEIKKYDERDARSLEAITPNNPNHHTFKVGMKVVHGMNIKENLNTDNWNGEGKGYTVITAVKESAEFGEDGIMTKAAKVETAIFNSKEEADAAIQATFEKAKNLAGKAQEKANAKYDAELAALNQPKVSESGVEVSADDMGLAGAFDVSEMGGDVLDILKEFETEPKVENKYIIDPLEYEKSLIEEEMILELSINKTQSKYKNAEVYKEIENKVKNKEKFNGFTSDEYIKISHKLLVSKNKDGILALDGLNEIKKYITNFEEKNKDFFKTQQGLNAFAVYNPKYGYWKLALEAIDFIMDVKSEKEIIDKYNTKLANLENNQENTRNVQENFLSLSEIKGTVENTQLKETQAEVFNENRKPLLKDAARMAPIIEKYKESLKEGGKPLNARDEARINKWAEENPDAYNKICK